MFPQINGDICASALPSNSAFLRPEISFGVDAVRQLDIVIRIRAILVIRPWLKCVFLAKSDIRPRRHEFHLARKFQLILAKFASKNLYIIKTTESGLPVEASLKLNFQLAFSFVFELLEDSLPDIGNRRLQRGKHIAVGILYKNRRRASARLQIGGYNIRRHSFCG